MAGLSTSNRNAEMLGELVEQKEKEWKEAQTLRIKSLEAALKEKEGLVNNERLRFRKLKEDFEYNLKLLQERDQELDRYDAIFAEYKSVGNTKDAEVSDLKIKLDDLQQKLKQEKQIQEDLQGHSRQRMQEHQQELNQFRLNKEWEVKRERDELEGFKRELQHQLRAAEEDIDTQRQTLISDFDDALHKREHEFRLKADEMSSNLLAANLKVKMLTKELEILRAHEEKTRSELQSTEGNASELEKKLKQKEWELQDERNMHSAKQSDLELQIGQLKASMTKMQEIFQHKQAELDRYARQKEAGLLAAKETHHAREQQLEENIREIQSRLDTAEVEFRRMEWENKDTLKDKDLQIERLQRSISELNEKLSYQATGFSRSSVAKDLELEALRQQDEKLRADLIQRTEDVERYKKELSLAAERESGLERSKAQLEFDWQRRCDDAERNAYTRQEELIKNLTRTKNEAVAISKERERELQQREDLIRILTETRDQAHATLQRHGLSIPSHLPSKERPGGTAESDPNVTSLQEQNRNLRDVIRQMRREMEGLNEQLATRPPSVMEPARPEGSDESVPLTPEYVKSLESEIRELKSKNRALSQRLEELPLTRKPPPSKESNLREIFGHAPVTQAPPDTSSRLQSKLKVAAKHIAQLAREKEQLIQMSNRLRAELAKLREGGSPETVFHPSPPFVGSRRQQNVTAHQMADNIQTQLGAMEKLQYALTSHELQVAQRMREQQTAAAGHARVTMGSSSSDSSDELGTARPVAAKPDPTKPYNKPAAPRRMPWADKPLPESETSPRRPLNLESEVPSSQRTSSPRRDQAYMTSSSEGHASLQEIWKLLDEEESFRSLSPVKQRPHRTQSLDHVPVREESGHHGLPDLGESGSDGFTLKRKKAEIDEKGAPQKPYLSRKALGKVKPAARQGSAMKIRNYNVRDDRQWTGTRVQK
ncbi:coiled-coil domain-containing protein 57 isoform X2 [Nematostella vectensis]|uniref:coiled-coil domain-containing protein 57 isoform X2 n=1 Tax=Nematostella vectensis TaxID=45351 RepID=UPI00207754F0|nr:coiled-coil domain-containing protein 57 isoform X2 [Nematostella vectensis]